MSRINSRIIPIALAICLAAAGPSVAQDKIKTEAFKTALSELRAELEWPGIELKTAAKNLGDAKAAYSFVRDGVYLANYRGSWAGASGALRTRAANSVDQALLLAKLLNELGHETRLLRAPWPADAKPHRAAGLAPKNAALMKFRKLLGTAPANKTETAKITETGKTAGNLEALGREVDEATKQLVKSFAAGGAADFFSAIPDAKKIAPVRSMGNWVWVQVKTEDGWVDFDPVMPKRPRPTKFVIGFTPKPANVRIMLSSIDPAGKSTVLFNWTGSADALVGFDANMRFLPDDEKTKSLKDVKDPAAIKKWKPLLQIGSIQQVGLGFSPAGTAPAPAKKPSGGFGFGGFGGSKPKKTPAVGTAALQLDITLTDPADNWTAKHTRTLMRLGPGHDSHALVSMYKVTVCPTIVPGRTLQARIADEMIDLTHFRQLADGGKAPAMWSTARGMSARSARVIDDLAVGLLAASQDISFGWNGPAVFVESFGLRKDKQGYYHVGKLDFLRIPWMPGAKATRLQRARWGLTVAAVEGALLRSKSVNAHLVQHAGALTLSNKALANDPAILKQTVASGGSIVRAAKAPQYAWAVQATGDVLAVVIEDATLAKGASMRERADSAADNFGAAGAAAMAALGYPSGMLVSGLVAYFKELAKAYEKVTNKLDLIGKAIASGDTSALEGDNDDYLKNLGKNLMEALRNGLIKGYVKAVVSTGVGQGLNGLAGTEPGSIGSRIINGLSNGGVSAADNALNGDDNNITPDDVDRFGSVLSQ